MINTYRVNRKVRITYEKNQYVYWLSKIPLLGDLITNKAYTSKGFKVLFAILNFFNSIIKIFAGKFIYLFIVMGIVGAAYDGLIDSKLNKPEITGKLFFVLIIMAVAGGFINNKITNVSSETHTSIMILRMDAKKYAISNYIEFLLKHFLGSVVVTWIICLLIKYYPSYMILFYPLYTIMIKIIVASFSIKLQSENMQKDNLAGFSSLVSFLVAGICILISAVGFIFLKLPAVTLIIVSVCLIPFTFFAWRYIVGFENYKYLYKKLLYSCDMNEEKTNLNKNEIKNYNKLLESNMAYEKNKGVATSDKKGYEYFNDIFIKRHRSIFYKRSLICSIIIFAVFLLLSLIGIISQNKNYFGLMKGLVEDHVCGFLLALYMVNIGESLTKAFFYNCDCSMLTYNFYRKKETVINLFWIRLKSIIKYNTVPTIIIAIGIDVLYCISSGDNLILYVITPISIIAMGIFFSVHYIFLYYVLQPFNKNLENKSATYGMCSGFTYLACFVLYDEKVNSLLFCPIMIGFTFLYVIVAFFVINKFGYKRFRLKS